MSDSFFVHLRVHSEFSILNGVVRLGGLASTCAKTGIPACAVTDVMNVFGQVKGYRQLRKAGIKPITAAEVWIQEDTDSNQYTKVVLLCQNAQGYHSLCQLISKAYLEGERDPVPIVRFEWLAQYQEGLIVLSGAIDSLLARALINEDLRLAKKTLQIWRSIFGDRFYLEVQRVGREEEARYLAAVKTFAKSEDVPVVATNAVYFLSEQDFDSHEARVCIHDGYILSDSRRPKRYTAQQYLKTAEQMSALFSDMPAAIENTVEIAKRCNFEFVLGQTAFPNFPVPNTYTTESFLVYQAEQGLAKRLSFLFPDEKTRAEKQPIYEQRLALELDVINKMGFAGYFLIVSDFIQWAINNGVPVGPGRGSGAGSIVAYALSITNLDPIAYDLLFERFLNPERVSLPDFDIDFCMEGRDRVIEYVSEKYGKPNVSQIATFGTMAAKAVVRDVGRVLGQPYGFVDKLAKLIPFEIGMTLDKALEEEQALKEAYDSEEEVKALIDLAKKLEGLTRSVGKHAGGVIIAPSALTDFAPIYTEEKSANPVTQLDKDDAEAVGLIKFDFLGLRTLTIINWAVQAINAHYPDKNLSIDKISINDPKVYALLKACSTTAVFQLESRGMKDLIHRLEPDRFEEIIALVALFRPGPLQSGMVDDYIERKHGRSEVEYLHPDLEEILKPTYGVILYQEQVMQIAQVLAGYTLGSADLLRRAMGKKKPEEMAKQREIFTKGSIENGVKKEDAESIFDLMEKFAGYGFNKSHSAAYALVSYQTAWLKTHYPDYFMAAVLSADMNHTDKVLLMIKECKRMGIEILPPDVRISGYAFSVEAPGKIRYGMGAIKGLGENVIADLIEIRQKQTFDQITDFFEAAATLKISKRSLEALLYSGALDGLGLSRGALLANLAPQLNYAQQRNQDNQSGQTDLFGGQSTAPEIVEAPDLEILDKLKGEKNSLGLYLSGHPMTAYTRELKGVVCHTLDRLSAGDKNSSVLIAGFVQAVRTMITKRGDRMAFITLEDQSGEREIALFSDLYQESRHLISKDELLIGLAQITQDERTGQLRIRVKAVYDLDHFRQQCTKAIVIRLFSDKTTPASIATLKDMLQAYQGPTPAPVWIEYQHPQYKAHVRLGDDWHGFASAPLIQDLQKTFGEHNVKLHYKKPAIVNKKSEKAD